MGKKEKSHESKKKNEEIKAKVILTDVPDDYKQTPSLIFDTTYKIEYAGNLLWKRSLISMQKESGNNQRVHRMII